MKPTFSERDRCQSCCPTPPRIVGHDDLVALTDGLGNLSMSLFSCKSGGFGGCHPLPPHINGGVRILFASLQICVNESY